MMAGWLQTWKRSPMLAGQFAATIALGMGAVTALVSLMLALGYQPLPFRDPGRLIAFWERVESGAPIVAISGPDLSDFADTTHSLFDFLGVFSPRQLWILDSRGAKEVP